MTMEHVANAIRKEMSRIADELVDTRSELHVRQRQYEHWRNHAAMLEEELADVRGKLAVLRERMATLERRVA